MSISLHNLRRVRVCNPPRILIYGPPGIGKTTLASEFPESVFLQVEDGTPSGVEVTSFGKLNSYPEVMSAMRVLYREDHTFKTLCVDSISAMQELVFQETCSKGDERGPKSSIEAFGYGKGYVYAAGIWQEFLHACSALRDKRGMTIILIAHSVISRFDDPETVSYDRYQIDLHSKISGICEREMDAILLLKQPVSTQTEDKGFQRERTIGVGNSSVLLYAQGRPAYTAKNRYGMPSTLRFEKGSGYKVLSAYFPSFGEEPDGNAGNGGTQ